MSVTRCCSCALRASNFCTCASTERSCRVSTSARGDAPRRAASDCCRSDQNHQPMQQRRCRAGSALAPMVTRCAAGMSTPACSARSRSTASRLMRIIGRPPGAARGRPPPPPSARRRRRRPPGTAWRRTPRVLNGSNSSTGASKRSASISVKPSARDAPPLTHDAVDAIGGGRRLEEVERLLDLEHHVLGDRAQHRPRVVEGHAVDRLRRASAGRPARTAGSAPSAAPRCRRCRRSRCRG